MEAGERIETEKSAGSGRAWFVQATPLRDQNGTVIGGVEIALDITEYKQAEQAREELPQEARQAEAGAQVDDPVVDLPPTEP
ncbi:MAG: PAS domain-containing protein [Planctomycetes bacterium]|nr:PAS domain-containing protein [Planctomycetota bacterium]